MAYRIIRPIARTPLALVLIPELAYRINSHWQIETILPNLGFVNYTHD